MKIYNIYGQEMQNISLPKDGIENTMRIETNTLPQGMYLLQLQGHGSTVTKKFIIDK